MLKNTSPAGAVTVAIITGVLSGFLGALLRIGMKRPGRTLHPEHPLFGRF